MVTLLGINISLDRLIFLSSVFFAIGLLSIVNRTSKRPSSWDYKSLLEQAIVCGLIVARLGYVAGHMDAYKTHPYEVLFFWLPGFAPLYGLAGGLAWASLRLWRERATHAVNFRIVAAVALPLVSALLFLGVQFQPQESTDKGSEIADALDNLPMIGAEGQPIVIKDLKGHSVVVNLWASWCVPCRIEMPILQDAQRRLEKSGLVVIGLDLAETQAQALAAARARGLSYVIASPVRSSEATRTQIHRLISSIGSDLIPVSIFFDASGKVKAVLIGVLSPGTIDDWLRRYAT